MLRTCQTGLLSAGLERDGGFATTWVVAVDRVHVLIR